MRTVIIALSAAALVATAPAALAQGVPGKTPGLQHKVSRKLHHPGVSGYTQMREMQAKGSKTGYPGVSGYGERSRFLESVREGGGGGGGSGM